LVSDCDDTCHGGFRRECWESTVVALFAQVSSPVPLHGL
jgi:hypothetical protein